MLMGNFFITLSLNPSTFRAAAGGAEHAVIIAGSHGYANYRHHADVCHAFDILSKGGVDPENIVIMLYDDVANDPLNPFPGRLFNAPSDSAQPGIDVYQNCQKDYTGGDVTASHFLSVLAGNRSGVPAGKKVLNSTSADRVFVNFVDHGGVGLLAMPTGPFLYQDELIRTLRDMHKRERYKELVFYVEACESGSVFDTLPNNLSIYVTTAADPTESSWGTYCPPNDQVFFNGRTASIGSCLGDLYSVNWMQNADAVHTKSEEETLEQQYRIVQKKTNLSHVQQYGTLSIANESIGRYEGKGRDTRHVLISGGEEGVSVLQWDAALYGAFYSYLGSTGVLTALAEQRLAMMLSGRQQIDTMFQSLINKHISGGNISYVKEIHHTNATIDLCQAQFYTAIRQSSCGRDRRNALSYTAEYALKYSPTVRYLCQIMGIKSKKMLEAIASLDCESPLNEHVDHKTLYAQMRQVIVI